jgi:hypothetical protein
VVWARTWALAFYSWLDSIILLGSSWHEFLSNRTDSVRSLRCFGFGKF